MKQSICYARWKNMSFLVCRFLDDEQAARMMSGTEQIAAITVEGTFKPYCFSDNLRYNYMIQFRDLTQYTKRH